MQMTFDFIEMERLGFYDIEILPDHSGYIYSSEVHLFIPDTPFSFNTCTRQIQYTGKHGFSPVPPECTTQELYSGLRRLFDNPSMLSHSYPMIAEPITWRFGLINGASISARAKSLLSDKEYLSE